jgi:hypothetical protein
MAALDDDMHRIVAALHDVVKDAADRGYDLEFLAARGVPPVALRAVEALRNLSSLVRQVFMRF